ncbi:MAG: hypothetical protein HQ581_25375, partial [Planctomycetes bacterium]|nr:hypothetical protein [Planctomycetota bacterium]
MSCRLGYEYDNGKRFRTVMKGRWRKSHPMGKLPAQVPGLNVGAKRRAVMPAYCVLSS